MASRVNRYFSNFFSANELDSAGDIETGSAEYHTVLNSINGYLRRSYSTLTDIVSRLDNILSNSQGNSVLLTDVKNLLTDINKSITTVQAWGNKYFRVWQGYFRNMQLYLSGIADDVHTIVSDYFPPSPNFVQSAQWFHFWDTFREKSFDVVLKDTLLEVQKEIDNQVNPLSDDNKESYTAAVDNLKKTTFVGSAYDVVETFPKKLNEALNADSRSVLQFTTAGTKNSYFSLPARTYSIDFSWYKPFKPTADVVISAFIYLGFAIAFFKRLPEIIQGAGVVYTGQVNFNESRLYEQVNDTMANNYYDYLVNNGVLMILIILVSEV